MIQNHQMNMNIGIIPNTEMEMEIIWEESYILHLFWGKNNNNKLLMTNSILTKSISKRHVMLNEKFLTEEWQKLRQTYIISWTFLPDQLSTFRKTQTPQTTITIFSSFSTSKSDGSSWSLSEILLEIKRQQRSHSLPPEELW